MLAKILNLPSVKTDGEVDGELEFTKEKFFFSLFGY
jgi:hypothetical protein